MNSSTSGFTGYEETTAETDGNNAGNAKVIVSMSGQIGEELPSVSMNFLETTAHERETERFQGFLLCLSGNVDDHVESDIFGAPIFGAQHHELFSSQAAGGQCNKLGASIHSFPESLQRDEAYKDSKERVGLLSKGFVKEADQLQRGIRRHLNFGAAIACEHTSYGAHETSNLCLPDSYRYSESFVPPHFDLRGITGSWQAKSCAQTATLQSSFFPSECEPVRSAQNCGNRALSSCIPSVGGNFVRSDSVGSDSSIRKKLRSNLHQHKEKLMSDGDHYLGKEMNGIPVSSFSGEIYTRMGDGQQESQAAMAAETVYRRAERGNNPSQEPRDTPETHSDCIKPNQFSSTLEALTDIGYLTPPSGCLLGVASSASLNLRGCPKISLVQSQQESGLLSSSGYFNWRHSPCNFTPKLYGSELGSDSFPCNKLEDSMPETLKNTYTPGTKAVKSFSLNQKRASPKIYSRELRSSSSGGLRSGLKFILQDLPSFPPLAPYCKSQAGIHQNDGDYNGSTGYQ